MAASMQGCLEKLQITKLLVQTSLPKYVNQRNDNEWEGLHWMREVSSSRTMASPCWLCCENGDLSPNSLQQTNLNRTLLKKTQGSASFRIGWFGRKKKNNGEKIDLKEKGQLGGPEEEPLEKGVALHASEEERLRRSIGSRVIQRRQFLLYFFHLPRRHFLSLPTPSGGVKRNLGCAHCLSALECWNSNQVVWVRNVVYTILFASTNSFKPAATQVVSIKLIYRSYQLDIVNCIICLIKRKAAHIKMTIYKVFRKKKNK